MWMIALIVAVAGVLVCGFFAGAETGLYCLNRLRLHLGVQQHDPRAIRLAKILADEQGALTVTLLGTNVGDYIVTNAVAYLLLEVSGSGAAQSEVYTVAIVTPVLFVFGQIVPKNIFQMHADYLMPRISALFYAPDRAFRALGVINVLNSIVNFVNQAFGVGPAARTIVGPRRRVTMLLQEALVGSEHGEHQSDLIERVVRLSETSVRAVMVPRHRVTALASAADRRELIRVVRAMPHGTLPVYGSRPNTIVGVVKVDEALRSDDWQTVAERMQPAISIQPNDSVASALVRMQAAKTDLAVVAAREGAYLGIITLRDLLEELTGELGEAA